MNRDWLWDRKTSINEIKMILKNPKHKNFILFASLLLARKNQPNEVFKKYINPMIFCTHWPNIKKNMRKDKWNSQRIIFWQAIYEKLRDRYHKKGISFREKKKLTINKLCQETGAQIRSIRKGKGLSQKALAKKLGVSQQLISRIEGGKENVSLVTLTNVLKALNKKTQITFT